MAGQSDIDTVRDATDLVRLIGEQVALRPKGREHVGLCPFHDDKNPSFAVVTHKGNAFYKCHSCGAGGDAFDFVMNYHRMEFGEALRLLADRAGITLKPRARTLADGQPSEAGNKRTDLRKANAFAAAFFQRTLSDPNTGAAAREVIKQRGISDEMVEAFMISAAPDQWDALANRIHRQSLSEDLFVAAGLLKPRKEGTGSYDAFRNRLIFPICDELGNPIAFGARKINPEDEPKYLNSAESTIFSKSKTLYGLHRAKRSIIESKQAIVTEGYTDVIACHQAGVTNAVGTLGTALTREHARMLSRLCDTVVLVFDGDEAGQKAADRGLEVFFAEPVDVKICVLPDELDPDELLKLPDGRARFDAALAGSIDALAYKIDRFREILESAGGISGRQKHLESFLIELSNLGFASMQGVRKSLVLAQLADLLGVSVRDIETALPKARRTATSAGASAAIESQSAATEAEPALLGDDAVAPVRRRAEHDLLAILIYQPELAAEMVQSMDGAECRLAELIDASDFADPLMRVIAEIVFARLARQSNFTVQQLLAEIDQPQAKSLVSTLYFSGERLCENPAPASGGASERAVQSFRSAVTSLQSHINLEHYHQTVSSYRQCKDAPEQAILAAQTVIEQRRRQGHIASAIGRGVRS